MNPPRVYSRSRGWQSKKCRYPSIDSSLFVNEYSPDELRHLTIPIKLCFAALPPTPPSQRTIHSLYHPLSLRDLTSPPSSTHLCTLAALRCDRAFSSFNIYPTTRESLAVNSLLWRVAHNGAYNPVEGDPLLGAHVFVLGLAPELHQFLSGISLSDMHRAIIDFLVLLHHQLTADADHTGLRKLAEDLVPEVYEELQANIDVFWNGEPTEPRRATVLEQIVQISFMTPWRVDVFGAYITPNDLTALTLLPSSPLCPQYVPPRSTLVHWRGAEQGVVMLKLYRDWRVFAALLNDTMGMPYSMVAEAAERAVHAGKSAGLMEQVSTVLEANKQPHSLLASVPLEVVVHGIVPWVVRRSCESIAPRQRRIASLKSLLELSSRYLEELRITDDVQFGLDVSAELLTDVPHFVLVNSGNNQVWADRFASSSLGLGSVQEAAQRVHMNETERLPRQGDSPFLVSSPAAACTNSQSEGGSDRYSTAGASTFSLNSTPWEQW